MPSAPSTAAEVLDRFIAASGGDAALRALPARSIEARMIVRAQEDCEAGDEGCLAEDQVGSFLLRTTADGQLYRRTVLDELVEEKGYDGTMGWQLSGDLLRVESDEELELSKEDAVLHWYFDLDERGIQVTLARPRKEDSAGQVAVLDGILWEVPGSGSSPKTMWFDRGTGLLREEIVEDTIETDEGEQTQRQTIVYEDYRDIGGIQVPHVVRVVNELGEQQQIVEFITTRVDHGAVAASQFAMPELPAPTPAPDQRLTALRAAQKAADAEPDDAANQVALTRAAWEAAHFETAEKAARATLAIDSAEPEALLLLARVLVLRGEVKEAADVLRKAESAGLRPEVITLESAWIHYRRRDFGKLAKTLDAVGNPVLAGRYRSFVGKPLQLSTGKGCVSSVPLVATSPLAVVEIMVEDEPVQAIVDTGASDLILSKTFATARGISVRSLGAQAPQGTPSVGYGQASSMTIGDATLKNVPVDVFDDRAMAEMAGEQMPEVKAVLGLSLLSELQISIDVPAETLDLVSGSGRCKSEREARRTGEGLPFWQHETHFLYVMGQLGAAEGLYLVNTGMRGADVAANLLAYGHAGLPIPPMREDVAMGTVDDFGLGPLTLSGLESAVAYTDPRGQIRGFFERVQTSAGFREDGMIGLTPLAKQRFTVDFETRRIYFGEAPGAQ